MSLMLHEMLLNAVDEKFISTWQTTAANETITLPLSNKPGSSHNFIVDWGDGNTSSVTSWNDPNATHTYAVPGAYQVKISGTMVGWEFNYAGDHDKILSVDNWGCFRVVPTQEGAFAFCANLDVLATDFPVLASGRWMFSDCPSLVGNSSFQYWDVSQIADFSYFFYACASFNHNIGAWNTSSAVDCEGMFYGATSFNQDIGGWDVSSVANMQNMFFGATSFNQDIGGWDVSSVTNMSGMFGSATSFNQDIGGWDVSSATNMQAMFALATSFNQDVGGWNVSSATNMRDMFNSAAAFNQNIGSWNTSSVTDMIGMFSFATAFNQNIGSWNTSSVTSMFNMFRGATAFNCGQPSGAVHTLMQRTATGGWRIGGISSADLGGMFLDASSFAGNISSWCADAATTLPTAFATNSNPNFTVARQPTWGACPIPD